LVTVQSDDNGAEEECQQRISRSGSSDTNSYRIRFLFLPGVYCVSLQGIPFRGKSRLSPDVNGGFPALWTDRGKLFSDQFVPVLPDELEQPVQPVDDGAFRNADRDDRPVYSAKYSV